MGKKTKKDSHLEERPLDPSRNAQDLIGDTSGLTGITTGSPKQSSAEPTDTAQLENTAHLPGGVEDLPGKTELGTPSDATNSKLYISKTQEGMSDTYKSKAEELASGRKNIVSGDQSAIANDTAKAHEEQDRPKKFLTNPAQFPAGVAGGQVTTANRQVPHVSVPSSQGEQSVSGDMPSPESDDDTLANAQQVGSQVDEDTEHPEEVDIARDIDEAEEWHREH